MYDHIITIHALEDRGITACDIPTAMARNADGFGVYFSINTIRAGVTTKPTKDDIVAIRYAHVDIDPPASGPWDKDAVFADVLSQNPSKVIDSGNGIQALWALVPGCTVDQVEQINKGLIQRFNADKGTWNADRVFRVPGTINWPNPKKISLGRKPTPTALLYEADVVYEAATLAACWPYTPPPAKTGPSEIEPVEWEPIPLPDGVSAELYDLVHYPKSSDRSSDVMKAVVLMGRENFTDAQIMGILLNDQLPISAHCLDQADPERQARRKAVYARDFRPKSGDDMFGDAVELPEGVYTEPVVRAKIKASVKSGFGLRAIEASQGVMLASSQLDHFKGCVYITHSDRVITPHGDELNQSRFDVVMGGYSFVIDDGGTKTTKSAWEAFLKNNCFSPPMVHNTCFRPELEPFEIVKDGTWLLVNTYQPIDTPRVDGDPSPFLRHMETLFPDDRDRSILLSYMASLVQNPGKKFQWWPVIQGAKGNGKTLLLNILTYCVGEQYSHLPNTSKMTRNGISFNGWLKGKLFLGMDEVYSSQRRDFLEEFKPYVTNRRLPIESKGVDEYTGDNRANGMMLTNHKDGVPVDKDERRYAVFFTHQQTAEDCFRDGLTPDHFQRLWAWLDGEGFAIINHYLRSYVPVPEFDPAQRASRAPRTSSTDQAIVASRGRAENEILEAVEDGRMGFKGGYISTVMLTRLLDEKRIKLPRNKFKDTLEAIGYIQHPSLVDGRSPGNVMPDGMRTRLYIPRDSIPVGGSPAAVGDDYTEKQMGA